MCRGNDRPEASQGCELQARESRLADRRPGLWSVVCRDSLNDPRVEASETSETSFRAYRTTSPPTLVMAHRDCFLARSLDACQEGR